MNYTITLAAILGCMFTAPVLTQAQDAVTRQQELYDKIIDPYLDFYRKLPSLSQDDLLSFHALFADVDTIQNDFYDGPGATEFFPYIEEYTSFIRQLFIKSNAEAFNLIDIIRPSGLEEMIFCQDNDYHYVWLSKTYYYTREKSTPIKMERWVRLKIRRQLNSYRIVNIVCCEKPMDRDLDRIADIKINNESCDECIATREGDPVDVKGCSASENLAKAPTTPASQIQTQQEQEVQQANRLEIERLRAERLNRLRAASAASTSSATTSSSSEYRRTGLIFSLAGGWNIPLPSAYSNKQLIDPKTGQWSNNGNLASGGLIVNSSLQFYFSKRLGITVGAMHIRNPMDTASLQMNTALFLARNGINYNTIKVSSSDAYQYNLLYFQFSVGGFRNEKHSLKIEPTIAQTFAYDGLSRDQVVMDINYRPGVNEKHALSFTTEQFLLYGAFLKYEAWIVPTRFGFSFSGFFLTGETGFTSQELTFRSHASSLRFSNQRIMLTGATLGLQVYLARGKKR